MIPHQLGLCLQFLHIVDGFARWWHSGRNSAGGGLTMTVLVLLFLTMSTSGIC
jgi:hypothetical protein